MARIRDYDNDWREGYIDVCLYVAQDGEVRDSRAGMTMEIRDFMFTLSPDAIDLPLGTGRKINTGLAAAEAIQLSGGVGMPELTEAVSKQVAEFVRDPDGTVHGNYGARMQLQIIDVVNKLQADPMSRQAIIQVWDKNIDSMYRKPMPKDIPCTLAMMFGIDPQGRVLLSVIMRSNDVWLGLPYDVFQFRQLQSTVSNLLHRERGQYTHHAVSMHAYDKNLGQIGSLALKPNWYQPALWGPNGLHAKQAADLPACAERVLLGEDCGSFSHEWYHTALGEAYATTLG
jgi:thymidylate synthase